MQVFCEGQTDEHLRSDGSRVARPQSGARDQQYDEEQLNDCDDEGSAGTEGGVIADAENAPLPKPLKIGESVVRDQSAGRKNALQKDVA